MKTRSFTKTLSKKLSKIHTSVTPYIRAFASFKFKAALSVTAAATPGALPTPKNRQIKTNRRQTARRADRAATSPMTRQVDEVQQRGQRRPRRQLAGRTWRMKPPWTDQGWSLFAGALANRGVHPPPTTSRPSLPPRCATAPPTDCLRKPVTGRHPSGSRGIPVSSPSSQRVARLPARAIPRVYPRSPSRARTLALAIASPFLRSRPLSRPPTNPSVNDDDDRHPSVCREHTECHPRTFSFPTQPRPSLSLESPRGPLGCQG